MKTILKYPIPLLLLAACTGSRNGDETIPTLYPQPQTIEANPDGGYAINTVTGDTIEPLVSENGETILTGVPIPAKGKTIHPDSVSQPKVVPLTPSDSSYNAHPNVHSIPKDLTVIPVNHDSLTTILVEEIAKNDTSHYLVNSIGDTVHTGIPIASQSKTVPTIQPQPAAALPPRFKDVAIINLQYIDVDQGMASYVLSICEDKSGNLWFGTWGSGVSMYDGKSYVHFTEKEGLSNNYVTSILEDKSGNLWIGTWGGGVSMYDGESYVHFTEKEGLSNNYVRSVLEDKCGNLWFSTRGSGVSKYDGESFTHFTDKEGLSNNFVTSICEDKSGNLWFGTWGGGVCMYDGKSYVHFTEKEGLSNNNVMSILEDKSGNLWFGTHGGGVCEYDGKSFRHFTTKEGLSNNFVNSIFEDNGGNLWFGTEGGGVCKYNGESFTYYTEKEGLSSNQIRYIYEDGGENIWFCTWGGGVSIYDRKSFTHFTSKEGLSSSVVRSILEDDMGNLWFGTDGGGVSKYDGESFTHFTSKEGLPSNMVYSSLQDKNGKLWFGTWGRGVITYDGESFTHFTRKEGLSSNKIIAIIEDNSGNLWFGTYGGGVCKYDGNSFTHFTTKEGLSNNFVYSIFEDNGGNLWFGTEGGGVCKYNGESFTYYTEKEGLLSNVIFSIFEDNNGNLWFGTEDGGVCVYDGKSFKHYTEKEGLSSNNVYSILEDKKLPQHGIWIGTKNGINEMVFEVKGNFKQQNTEIFEKITTEIFRFEKNDGLKSVDFLPNSICLDSKNRMWWGSGKSLTMLDMNKYNPARNPPALYLKQLDINEQFIDYRNITDSLGGDIEFNGVQKFENYPLNLELAYNKNHLTFHFSAIDWNAPHKIQYSYIMEGLNTSWSKPSHEAKADYRNLPFGSYTFKVRAIGESNEWSEAFEYEFTIHPPWWNTWWARIGYGVSALLLIFGFVRWRTAKLKQRQKELETEVAIATQGIRAQKEVVEEAHKQITDSINYAERIQRSFLATKQMLDANLNEYFVFFQPKEAVSGDFYWAGILANGNFAIVNADSTGHGVPGAIMSILNVSSIEKAVEKEILKPSEIFNETRKLIIERLKKDGSSEGGKEGMDASLISINANKTKMFYVAAQNPIWVIRNGKLTEIKPEKMPVGKHENDTTLFEGGEYELQKGDLIYTLTDGFQDQFGGPQGKKFMAKKMREYILSISHISMDEQHQRIKEDFANWKGDLEQVDDVCVIGLRI